jgi:hypothetical protein
MDLHNKLTQDHLAWFNNNIAKEKTEGLEDSEPMPITDELVFKYKRKHRIQGDITFLDMLYDEDIIICPKEYERLKANETR